MFEPHPECAGVAFPPVPGKEHEWGLTLPEAGRLEWRDLVEAGRKQEGATDDGARDRHHARERNESPG